MNDNYFFLLWGIVMTKFLFYRRSFLQFQQIFITIYDDGTYTFQLKIAYLKNIASKLRLLLITSFQQGLLESTRGVAANINKKIALNIFCMHMVIHVRCEYLML